MTRRRAGVLDLAAAFPPVLCQAKRRPGRRVCYAPQLRELANVRASGVYAIVQAGRALYVGESHTGRLFDTITRHFRSWTLDPSQDEQGRRRGGTTYDRRAVRVVYAITEDDAAQAIQYAEIQRLRPRDNRLAGSSGRAQPLPDRQGAITIDQLEPAPF